MAAVMYPVEDLNAPKIFRCLSCFDDFKEAITCPKNHSICTICFDASIVANGGIPDNMLKCQAPKCGQKVNFTNTNVEFMSRLAVITDDRITELAKTNDALRVELNPKAQKKANIALAESMAQVYSHFKKTIEGAVPRCPECSTIVADFSGCVAITCECNSFLCALCLKVFPTNQATHDHILNDHKNEPGLKGHFTIEYIEGNKPSGRGKTIDKCNRKLIVDSIFC
jgi:hypothetical protein